MEFTAKQPHVILFYKMTPESRSLPCLMGRHRTDFLPVLRNPAAPWRRLEVCWSRTTGRTPASAPMIRIDDLIYSARQLTCVRPARCNRIHLFWPCIRLDRKTAGRMRADPAGFGETECIVIGNQDCISQHTCGYRFAVHHSASQPPGSGQQFVLPLSSGRLCH